MNSDKKGLKKVGKIGKKDVKNLTNTLAFLKRKAYTVTGFDPERSGTFLCGACVKKVTKGAALFAGAFVKKITNAEYRQLLQKRIGALS